MGEIADMMLDGTLCEGCGVYMEGTGMGFPQRCGACRHDERRDRMRHLPPKSHEKVACQVCGRHVKAAGINDHMRDKHGDRS